MFSEENKVQQGGLLECCISWWQLQLEKNSRLNEATETWFGKCFPFSFLTVWAVFSLSRKTNETGNKHVEGNYEGTNIYKDFPFNAEARKK